MSRRPATFTQADIARAIRAAKREGAATIEIRPSGSIVIRLVPADGDDRGTPVEAGKEVIL